MTLAFSSKHQFVPNPKTDPAATRWIASLSDGSTVFEDVTPYEKSAWRRLREYVMLHHLKITNLRLEAYGYRIQLIPYKDENNVPQIRGYWQSRRMEALLANGVVSEKRCCGVGYIKDENIIITWVSDSGIIQQEVRPVSVNDEACILNDLL